MSEPLAEDGTVRLHHQEQCPWCGKYADWDGPEVGMVVLNGLWRPVHLGSKCERLVNAWLTWGTKKPPFYDPHGIDETRTL